MNRFKYAALTIVVAFAGLSFAIKNWQPVELTYYFGIRWTTQVSILVLAVLTLGIAAGYLIGVYQVLSIKRDLGKANKKVQEVEKEVQNLRSLPVKDVI